MINNLIIKKVKNLYIILGRANKGKSTLMRCLTGIYRSKSTLIRTNLRDIDMYIFTSSLQEKGWDIQTSVINIDNVPNNNVFIAIRIDSTRNCPIGQDYLDVLKLKYNIVEVVILGNEVMNISNNITTRISSPKQDPPNYEASLVRKQWGWV